MEFIERNLNIDKGDIMEIKSEFLRELQGKVNCQKNILDIVKCALDMENGLNEEVQNYIKGNVK